MLFFPTVLFKSDPCNVQRFVGMTLPVANCLDLDFSMISPTIPSALVPTILVSGFVVCRRAWGIATANAYTYTFSYSFHGVHLWIACALPSRCPSSCRASATGGLPRRRPVVLRVVPQVPMDPVFCHDCSDDGLSAALDLVLNEENEKEVQYERHEEQQAEDVMWSLSMTKRRKRGR